METSGFKISREPKLIRCVGRTSAKWGLGHQWLRFFEIYNCELSPTAASLLWRACQQPAAELLALTRDVIVGAPPKAFAANAFAILEGFADLPPEEQNQLVHQTDESTFFGDWRRYVEDELILGISVAGLVRIKIDDHYIFMKEDGVLSPLGGTFLYGAQSDRNYLESLGAFGFLEDCYGTEFARDLRFLLPKSQVGLFEHWLHHQLGSLVDSRVERSPVRELREELVDELGAISASEFEDLLRPQVFSCRDSSLGLDLVSSLLNVPTISVRISAMEQLAQHGGISSLSKLGWALEDSSTEVAISALRILGPLLLAHPSLSCGLATPYRNKLLSLHSKYAKTTVKRTALSRAKVDTLLKGIDVHDRDLLAEILCSAESTRLSVADDFSEDPSLLMNDDIEVVIAIKRMPSPKQSAFDQVSERARIDLVGRASWRPPFDGMIAKFSLRDVELEECRAICKRSMCEPYDLVRKGDGYIVCAGNGLLEIDSFFRTKRVISSTWFAQIHSLDISRDCQKVLVASSGFDAVFEVELASEKVTWEWFAFENENSQELSPFMVTRSRQYAESLRNRGFGVLLIEDPRQWTGGGVPTRYRTHHINEASYAHDNRVLITAAQTGVCAEINKETGISLPCFSGLQTPHGFCELASGRRSVADTRRGRVLISGSNGKIEMEIDFTKLAGLTTAKRDADEWIQNAIFIRDNILLVIDRGRDRLWLLDLIEKTYRGIRVPTSWRIHKVRPV